MAVDFQNMFFSENVDLKDNLFEREEDFVNSAREWMRHYVLSPMESFSITFSKPEMFLSDVENLVNFSVDHEAKTLTLDFSDPSWKEDEDDFDFHPPAFELPLHVYSHAAHVESIALFCCKFSATEFRNFTALKHLSLGNMNICVSTIKVVLSSCSSLQSLIFKRCILESFCDVSLAQVNSLVIDNCMIQDGSFYVLAPRLKYLMYKGEVYRFDLEIDRHLFGEAVLDFGPESKYEFNDDDGVLLQNLLGELYSVRMLTVCSFMLQLLPHGEEPIHGDDLSVHTLKLNTALHLNELEGIRWLFNNCPHLKTLIMDIGSPEGKILDDYEAPFKFTGFYWCPCVKYRLENVEMNGFNGKTYQLPMLKYLLSVGSRLEKLTVKVSTEGDSSLYARKAQHHLQQFQKASKNVQIVIC